MILLNFAISELDKKYHSQDAIKLKYGAFFKIRPRKCFSCLTVNVFILLILPVYGVLSCTAGNGKNKLRSIHPRCRRWKHRMVTTVRNLWHYKFSNNIGTFEVRTTFRSSILGLLFLLIFYIKIIDELERQCIRLLNRRRLYVSKVSTNWNYKMSEWLRQSQNVESWLSTIDFVVKCGRTIGYCSP